MSARKEALRKLRDRYRAEILDCVNQVNDKLNSPNKSTKSALNYDECLPKKLSEIAKALSATKVLSHSVHLATAAALNQEVYIHRLTSNRKQMAPNAPASLNNMPPADEPLAAGPPPAPPPINNRDLKSHESISSQAGASSDSRAVARALFCPNKGRFAEAIGQDRPNLAETAAAAFARRAATATTNETAINAPDTQGVSHRTLQAIQNPIYAGTAQLSQETNELNDLHLESQNLSTHTSDVDGVKETVIAQSAPETDSLNNDVSSLSLSDSTTPMPVPLASYKETTISQEDEETPLAHKALNAGHLKPLQPLAQPAPIGKSKLLEGAKFVQEFSHPPSYFEGAATQNLNRDLKPPEVRKLAASERLLQNFPTSLQLEPPKNLSEDPSQPIIYMVPNSDPSLSSSNHVEIKPPPLDLTMLNLSNIGETGKQYYQGPTGAMGSITQSDVTTIRPQHLIPRSAVIHGMPLDCASGVPISLAARSRPQDQPWFDPYARVASATQTDQSVTSASQNAHPGSKHMLTMQEPTISIPESLAGLLTTSFPMPSPVTILPPPALPQRLAGLLSAAIPPLPQMSMPPPPPRLLAAAPPQQRALFQQSIQTQSRMPGRFQTFATTYNTSAPRSMPIGDAFSNPRPFTYIAANSQYGANLTVPQQHVMRRSPLIGDDVQKIISSRIYPTQTFAGLPNHSRGMSLTLPIISKR